MAKLPATIFRAMPGVAVPEDAIIRRFAFEGYGARAAKKWIREFTALGWIRDNDDGTYSINVPYRH